MSKSTARWRMFFLLLAMSIAPFTLAHACGDNACDANGGGGGAEGTGGSGGTG